MNGYLQRSVDDLGYGETLAMADLKGRIWAGSDPESLD